MSELKPVYACDGCDFLSTEVPHVVTVMKYDTTFQEFVERVAVLCRACYYERVDADAQPASTATVDLGGGRKIEVAL